jgi:hypothetical protein
MLSRKTLRRLVNYLDTLGDGNLKGIYALYLLYRGVDEQHSIKGDLKIYRLMFVGWIQWLCDRAVVNACMTLRLI